MFVEESIDLKVAVRDQEHVGIADHQAEQLERVGRVQEEQGLV